MKTRIGWIAVVLAGTFSLTSIDAHSEDARRDFGDWSVIVADDGGSMYAATSNDSEEVLGEFCSFESGSCSWRLGMDTACEKGDEYPLLANSSSGAQHLMVTCLNPLKSGGHVYGFAWKDIESVIKDAKWMGMAFPMDGDAFRVVRFSLKGMDEATRFLETVFFESVKSGKRGTKSQIL